MPSLHIHREHSYVRLWDVKSGKKATVLDLPDNTIVDVAADDQMRWFYTINEDRYVQLLSSPFLSSPLNRLSIQSKLKCLP